MHELAASQHGIFTLEQARAAGMTPSAVQHQLRTGRWGVVRPGVYRVPGSVRTWEQRVMAAVLAAGPGAAASHRSAAALLGIPGFPRQGAPELSVPRTKRHRDATAAVHQCNRLPPAHITWLDGIPSTRVARTLVDLAGVVHPSRFERAVDNCLSARSISVEALAATMDELARPGRPGIAILRRLLDDRGAGYVAPASALEARFRRLVRAAGLPAPDFERNVGDDARWIGRADGLYRDILVLVELDSRRHHMSKLDFEADRERDNRRVAAGWRPLRFTWHDVTARPDEVIDVLVRAGVVPHRHGDVKCRKVG